MLYASVQFYFVPEKEVKHEYFMAHAYSFRRSDQDLRMNTEWCYVYCNNTQRFVEIGVHTTSMKIRNRGLKEGNEYTEKTQQVQMVLSFARSLLTYPPPPPPLPNQSLPHSSEQH